MKELMSIIEWISSDEEHGSSEIYRRLLDDLLSIAARVPERKDWDEFVGLLQRSKGSMAAIQNVALSLDTMLKADIPPDHLNGMIVGFIKNISQRERQGGTLVAERFISRFRPTKIITLSYSGTVMGTLSALRSIHEFEVYVSESLPLGEGALTARRLMEMDIPTMMFRDSMVSAIMGSGDMVVLGADAITAEGVINKVGSRPMALAAKERGIPVCVVCTGSKMISKLSPDEGRRVHDQEGRMMIEMIFEVVPWENISWVVTDDDILTSEEAEMRLRTDREGYVTDVCHEC